MFSFSANSHRTFLSAVIRPISRRLYGPRSRYVLAWRSGLRGVAVLPKVKFRLSI